LIDLSFAAYTATKTPSAFLRHIFWLCDFEGVQTADVVVKSAWASAADRSGHICAMFKHCQPISKYRWVTADNSAVL